MVHDQIITKYDTCSGMQNYIKYAIQQDYTDYAILTNIYRKTVR